MKPRSKHSVADLLPLALTGVGGQIINLPHSGGGWVHLQFRRFAGCPICSLHLRSFARRADELRSAGIRTVVVFHSSQAALEPYQDESPFDLIADPTKRLYRRFGVEASLLSVLNPRTWLPGLRGLTAGRLRVPVGGGPFGLPGDFLFSANGELVAEKRGLHANDQWSVDDVLRHTKARSAA